MVPLHFIGGLVFYHVIVSTVDFCLVITRLTDTFLRFFPETLRVLVGDGSIPPPVYSQPLIPIIGRKSRNNATARPPRQPFANPLRLFLHLDVTILLLANGVIYSAFYGVAAAISTLFKEAYPFLGETAIGLCFLSIGGGMLIGGVVAGKVLDREYRRTEQKLLRKMKEKAEDPESVRQIDKDSDDFPIERARFRTMPIYLVVFIATCAGYGWTLQQGVNLACPLVLLIISKFA